jgi:hypothetical protein
MEGGGAPCGGRDKRNPDFPVLIDSFQKNNLDKQQVELNDDICCHLKLRKGNSKGGREIVRFFDALKTRRAM